MGRETRGNFSDVEDEQEKESGATEIGSDNNRLKSSPLDYSEIKIEGEVSKRHFQAQANPSLHQYTIVSNP